MVHNQNDLLGLFGSRCSGQRIGHGLRGGVLVFAGCDPRRVDLSQHFHFAVVDANRVDVFLRCGGCLVHVGELVGRHVGDRFPLGRRGRFAVDPIVVAAGGRVPFQRNCLLPRIPNSALQGDLVRNILCCESLVVIFAIAPACAVVGANGIGIISPDYNRKFGGVDMRVAARRAAHFRDFGPLGLAFPPVINMILTGAGGTFPVDRDLVVSGRFDGDKCHLARNCIRCCLRRDFRHSA